MIALQAAVVLGFGTGPRAVAPILPNQPVHVLGATVARDRLWLGALVVVAAVGLGAGYRRPTFGLATRARSRGGAGAAPPGGGAGGAAPGARGAAAGSPAAAAGPRSPPRAALVLVPAAAIVVALVHGGWRVALVTSMTGAVVCLSLVVLTGYVGQLSLAQMAFAGVAGFTLSRLAQGAGVPFPLAPLVAAVGGAGL